MTYGTAVRFAIRASSRCICGDDALRALAQGLAAGQHEFELASKLSPDNSAKLEKVLGLIELLLSSRSDGISGKLISAQWDSWSKLEQFKDDLTGDIFTLRRIVPEDRGKKWDST